MRQVTQLYRTKWEANFNAHCEALQHYINFISSVSQDCSLSLSPNLPNHLILAASHCSHSPPHPNPRHEELVLKTRHSPTAMPGLNPAIHKDPSNQRQIFDPFSSNRTIPIEILKTAENLKKMTPVIRKWKRELVSITHRKGENKLMGSTGMKIQKLLEYPEET